MAKEPTAKRVHCEACVFFETAPQGNGDGPAGECHRFPEARRKNATDWCGEGEKA